MKAKFHLLTLVTNKGSTPTEHYLQFIENCISSGCISSGITCIQLREKSLLSEELFHFGISLKHLLDSNNIPLIINDDVDLCIKLDAFGVHLGQLDGDVTKARSALGPNKVIGLSVNNLQQVKLSNQQPIDYIGVGAIFPTNSKLDIENIWGLDALEQASVITSRPIVAIGGIDDSNALSVMNAGADGIAAIGAFHNAKDPDAAIQNLIKIIHGANNDR